MWRLADRQIDEFIAKGECEFVERLRRPVRHARHRRPARRARGGPRDASERAHAAPHGRLGSTDERARWSTRRSSSSTSAFTAYIEDRRREPRDDVLTGSPTATFPDGSTPEVDRRRPDRRQPLRRRPGDHRPAARRRRPAARRATRTSSSGCATDRDADPELRRGGRCASRARSRATSACRGCRRPSAASTIPAGTTVMVLNGAANRDPRQFDDPPSSGRTGPTPASTSPSATASTSAPGAPLARAEGRVTLERLLDRMARHPHLRGGARPARRPPLPLPADLHPPRPEPAPPRVHAGRLIRRARSRATSPSHRADGFTVRSKVSRSKAMRPKVFEKPAIHSKLSSSVQCR